MSQIREVLKNSKQGITRDNFKHNVDPITEHEFIMLTSSMWILTLWEYSYKNNAYTGGNSEKKTPTFDIFCVKGWMKNQPRRYQRRVKV